jgi:drug/metabolite transporter (DMT)-like permease
MNQHLGQAAALTTALLWTLSILAWTSAGRHVGALAVSFIRLLIASLFLLLYGQIVRGLALPLDASPLTWSLLGLSGLFGLCLADICMFKACLLIGPRLTLLVNSLMPPMAALLSRVWLGDELTLRHWLAMLITVAGIWWVVAEQPDADGPPRNRRVLIFGVALAVVSAVGQALGLVLAKQGLGDYDAMAATFIRTLGALAGYLLLITLWRRWPAMYAAARHGRAMRIVVFGSFVGPFLGVALYMVALRHCHAGVVATLTSMMPVLILPFVMLLYHEKVSLRAAAGAAVSVAGVALLVL